MDRDWQNEVLGFSFADSWALLALPLVLAIWWWRLRRRSPALGFAATGLLAKLPRTLRARLVNLPLHLVALGLVPLCLALARPQMLTRLPIEAEGIDILICLDVSSSMSERDMDRPIGGRNRLEVAKDVASDFASGRADDRIGLVTFAQFPDVRCPMTLDKEALKRFLEPTDHATPNTPEDGTGIGLGLALCVKQLEKSEAKSRVVILLTDGQENVMAISPLQAGKLAKDEGIRVYAIGAGKGSRHPLLGHFQEMDFSDLRKIAGDTGGEFYLADDDEALQKVFERIDELERSELEDPLYVAEEIFFPFLALGALCLLLAFVLRLGWIVEVP